MSKASFNEAMTRAGFDSDAKISKANLAACLVALKDGHSNWSAVELAMTDAGFSGNDKISKLGSCRNQCLEIRLSRIGYIGDSQ